MGLLMSGGVESKLNFVGEFLKGCDERSWLGLDVWRDGSRFFVPTLMTVHRTHLLFHLSRDRCRHRIRLCSYTLSSAEPPDHPHMNLSVMHWFLFWTCMRLTWKDGTALELHGLALPCAGSRWVKHSPALPCPWLVGESRRAHPHLARDVHPCNHKKSAQEVRSSLKRVGTKKKIKQK